MKIRISLLLLLIIGTVACTRPTCMSRTFRPETCNLYPVSMSHIDSISGLEHTDSMYLNVAFEGQKIGCASFFSFSLGAEMMAEPMIPVSNWENPLVSFAITSNQDFNDIPAGQSLKSKFWGLSDRNQKVSVDAYLQPFIENEYNMNYTHFRFQFSEIPQERVHTFTVTLNLADGRILEAIAENVPWK